MVDLECGIVRRAEGEYHEIPAGTALSTSDPLCTGKVPGALRDDPIPEDSGIGDEPAVEIVISDPGGRWSLDADEASVASQPDPDDGQSMSQPSGSKSRLR